MIVLGIDTSAYINAVGVIDGDRILADAAFSAKTDSLTQIVANIDDVLKSAGLSLDTVKGIGVGLGPGSWTGIRVGVTVGKMLALAAGKPVCGIPTLEALAFAAGAQERLVCPLISVGAGNAVYAACYRVASNKIDRQGDYFAGEIKELASLIKEPYVIVGAGAAAYAETLSRESKHLVEAVEAVPGGAAVAVLAGRRLVRGESDDALALIPLYLKESTAKVFVNRYKGQ